MTTPAPRERATHTPGPWMVNPVQLNQVAYFSKARGNAPKLLAVVDAGLPPDECIATARLIAAAPDMLAALQLIAELPDATGAIAHEAVAKATGASA